MAKPWIKMIPLKWYDIISRREMIIIIISLCHVLTQYPRTHQDDMAGNNKHILFETCVRMWLLYIVNAQEDHNTLHGFELSNQIDCNNFVGPIRLHVIFSWHLALGRIAFQFYQHFLVLQLGGLIFFKPIICNKQIITCWEPGIVFIHSFLIPYRSLARRLARSRYGIKNSWIRTIPGS